MQNHFIKNFIHYASKGQLTARSLSGNKYRNHMAKSISEMKSLLSKFNAEVNDKR